MDFSLPAERVIRALDQIIEWRGKPDAIRSGNGPEYIGHKLGPVDNYLAAIMPAAKFQLAI